MDAAVFITDSLKEFNLGSLVSQNMTNSQNLAFETNYNQVLTSIKKRFGSNLNKDSNYFNTNHSSPNEKFLDLMPDAEIITEIEDSEDSNLSHFPKAENLDLKTENLDTKTENLASFDLRDIKEIGKGGVGGSYDDGLLRVIQTDRGFGSGGFKGGKVKGGKKKGKESGGSDGFGTSTRSGEVMVVESKTNSSQGMSKICEDKKFENLRGGGSPSMGESADGRDMSWADKAGFGGERGLERSESTDLAKATPIDGRVTDKDSISKLNKTSVFFKTKNPVKLVLEKPKTPDPEIQTGAQLDLTHGVPKKTPKKDFSP